MKRGSDSTREVNERFFKHSSLSKIIPSSARVIHRFANVCLAFRQFGQAEIMLIKPVAVGFTLAAFLTPSTTWQLPLDSPIRLVRQFQQPSSDYSAGHRGVDYAVDYEQPVFAPADGFVIYSGMLVDRPLLSLNHANQLISEVEPVCSSLGKGERVQKGKAIGYVCQPRLTYRGHCAAEVCLHFSVRKDGRYISPLALIGGLSPSRLLPYARG